MIVYQGPSLLDGKPIVALATGGSKNRKTGPMIQTWILCADLSPTESVRAHADESVCGSCPQRRGEGGSCYVVPHQAPQTVWHAWRRGVYAHPDSVCKIRHEIENGAKVRLGAYGDPVAVPLEAWEVLLEGASGHVGYTHQWRSPAAALYRSFLMASCDSLEDVEAAQGAGWRTFHAVAPGQAHAPGSIQCLSDARDLTCAECGVCDGSRLDRVRQPASVWIAAHGHLLGRYAKRAAGLVVK